MHRDALNSPAPLDGALQTPADNPAGWRLTGDGSLSWYDDTVDEWQHNRAGAYTEAMTQYVTPLLQRFPGKADWHILDACFGLGYNTWAFLQAVTQQSNGSEGLAATVHVWGVDINPDMFTRSLTVLPQPVFQDLTRHFSGSEHKIYYQTQPGAEVQTAVFTGADWINGLMNALKTFYTLVWQVESWRMALLADDLQQAVAHWPFLSAGQQGNSYPALLLDAVFHDAHSWHKVPHLWHTDLFRQYGCYLKPNGLVLTYSRAAKVKHAFEEAGFILAKTPGLGGKKGGLLAVKP